LKSAQDRSLGERAGAHLAHTCEAGALLHLLTCAKGTLSGRG